MNRLTYPLVITLLLLCSCAKWKVNDLKKNVLFNIKAGNVPGEINLQFANDGYIDLTFDMRVSNDKIYCSDNIEHRFQVFNRDGKPLLAIGVFEEDKVSANSLITYRDFSFGSIGSFVADKEGTVYIQNTILPDKAGENDSATNRDSLGMSPSNILVFNSDGRIMYSLGQNGASDVPFYSIYNMYTDDLSRLFVISKSYENWSVFRYDGKSRDFALHLDKDYFKESEGDEHYRGVVENIIIFNSGEKLLISVAYYAQTRFKYRKIYEYKIYEDRLGNAILHLPDPRNELFSILEDKYIILWDVEKQDIRFSIWNLQENIINNLRINLQGKRPFYEKVLVDEKGRLYTMIVESKSVEIKEWK